MTREQLLSSVWVRMVIFAWLFVFPIVFVALPFAAMYLGEREQDWTPLYGLLIWITGPLAGSVLLKWIEARQDSLEKGSAETIENNRG